MTEHLYIGPNRRFWQTHYSRGYEAPIWDWVNRYSSPCPGNVFDKQNAIGKFERWNNRGHKGKAYWLHWKLRVKE